MWTAAILAGGRARRMDGREKATLVVGGRSILDRQLAVLHEIAEHIVLVTSDRTRFAKCNVPVVVDRTPNIGPLGGLHTAIAAATTERILAVAGDMPFLTVPFLKQLRSAGENADIVMLRTAEGYHPLCGTFAKSCTTRLEQLVARGMRRLSCLLDEPQRLRVRVLGPDEIAPFDRDGRLLFNVNTSDDYARAIEMATEPENEPDHSDRTG